MDPGQPLVNAIRTDSALIGGNSVHLSKGEQPIKAFHFDKVHVSDIVINTGWLVNAGKLPLVPDLLYMAHVIKI